MESTSKKKRKLTLDKELCSERNAYYKKLRREQKKKRKGRGKTAKQPEAVPSKEKVTVTDFCPRQVRQPKEVKAKEALSRGKMMVSAALKIAAKPQENEKQNKEPTSTRRSQTPSTDVLEVKSAKRIPGAKSVGSGTFGTCYPGTFRGIRVVIKEYNDTGRPLKSLQREVRHEAFIIKQLGDHPGIPLLFGVSTKDIPVSLVLKFHGDSGESLTIYKAAKSKKRSEGKEWSMIFLETAEAVEHIHSCGYVHNDLKSNNVVLEKREDERLHPVIIDFGKSVAIHKAVNPVAKPLHVRELYKYVAPELLDGTGKPSVESDVFALAYVIKSVHDSFKWDMPVAVKNALAKSASDRPPVSSIKAALRANN